MTSPSFINSSGSKVKSSKKKDVNMSINKMIQTIHEDLKICKFILKNVFPALTPRLQYELNIDVRRKHVLKLLLKIIIIRS